MPIETGVLAELSAAAPTFDLHSRRSFEDNPNVAETIARLVEHLGEREVQLDELVAVLQAAERILAAGDPKQAGFVGWFIEDLQLFASYPDVALEPGDLEAMLPPMCRSRWDALDTLWRAAADSMRVPDPPMTLETYRAIDSPDLRRIVRGTHRVLPDGGSWVSPMSYGMRPILHRPEPGALTPDSELSAFEVVMRPPQGFAGLRTRTSTAHARCRGCSRSSLIPRPQLHAGPASRLVACPSRSGIPRPRARVDPLALARVSC